MTAFVVLAASFLAVAAYTLYFINTEQLGKQSTGAEMQAHYSGKSLLFGEYGEAYYAPDGIYNFVGLDEPYISVGTWAALDGLNGGMLRIEAKAYSIKNGSLKVSHIPVDYRAYIQTDASALLDRVGGSNYSHPKPRFGFANEARFNKLRRQFGI